MTQDEFLKRTAVAVLKTPYKLGVGYLMRQTNCSFAWKAAIHEANHFGGKHVWRGDTLDDLLAMR